MESSGGFIRLESRLWHPQWLWEFADRLLAAVKHRVEGVVAVPATVEDAMIIRQMKWLYATRF